MSRGWKGLVAVVLLLSSAGGAFAQSEDEARARELIQKIRRDLRRIDELLLEMDENTPAEARRRMEEVRENLERLVDPKERLQKVTETQAEVLEAIDELVKLTKYTQSSSSSGGGSRSSDPQQGEQGSNRERERDREPDRLERQQPPGARPRGAREEPRSGRPDREPKGERKEGAAKPPADTEEVEREDTSGRWGVLPPKVQELFQNLDPDQFPAKYQRLLELYYRKAAEKKEEG